MTAFPEHDRLPDAFCLDRVRQVTNDYVFLKYALAFFALPTEIAYAVETGTNLGDSTRILQAALATHGGQLTSVDVRVDVPELAQELPTVTFITQDALTWHATQPIDLLFLDDDHESAHVRQELAWFRPQMRHGARILLHDVFHGIFGEGIRRAIETFCTQWGVAYFYLPDIYGLGVIEVRHVR